MKFEDILEGVGSFGAYQKLLSFTLLVMSTGLVAMTYYTQIFILTAPSYHCRPHTESNITTNDSPGFNFSEHFISSNNFTAKDFTCRQFNETDLGYMEATGNTSIFRSPEVQCSNGWQYDFNTMFSTITSENDWVCQEAWKPYVLVTCFWVGNTVGAWIFGGLSDLIGRRPVIAAALLVYGAAGVGSSFVAHHYWGFLIMRILAGLPHHTVTHLPFILVVEYCGIKSRTIPLFTIMVAYTLGSFVAPLAAMGLWDWKSLLYAASIPSLCLLIFYKWLPESPSWMLTKGHTSRAVDQLYLVSKFNKTMKTKDQLRQQIDSMGKEDIKDEDNKEPDENQSPPLTHILKFPKLRRNVFAVLYVWMIGCLCFYGHAQNTGNLGSNIFMSYLLGASIEIPSWSVPYLIERFGRKITLVSAFLLSGICGIIYATLPAHLEQAVFAFALMGRLFITGAYYITLQYGPEIFPTVIRGRGVAMSETLGGIAIFISPLIVYLGEIQRTLPLVIFSILACTGGITTLILPETKGKALPQTLPDAELFAKESAPKLPCMKRKRVKVNTMDQNGIHEDTSIPL